MLTIGNFYKLIHTIENEHQDHFFTYPAGLIVRLKFITTEDELSHFYVDNEDGVFDRFKKIGEYKVYHFDIVSDGGMSYVFREEDVEPASQDDLKNGVHVLIERC